MAAVNEEYDRMCGERKVIGLIAHFLLRVVRPSLFFFVCQTFYGAEIKDTEREGYTGVKREVRIMKASNNEL